MPESTSLFSPVALLTTDARKPVEDHITVRVSGGGYRAMLFHTGVHWRLIGPEGAPAHRAVAVRAGQRPGQGRSGSSADTAEAEDQCGDPIEQCEWRVCDLALADGTRLDQAIGERRGG